MKVNIKNMAYDSYIITFEFPMGHELFDEVMVQKAIKEIVKEHVIEHDVILPFYTYNSSDGRHLLLTFDSEMFTNQRVEETKISSKHI